MPLGGTCSSLPVQGPGCYLAGVGKEFAAVFGVGLVLVGLN